MAGTIVFWVLHSTSHSDPTRRRPLELPNWKQHCTLPGYGLYTSKTIKLLPLFWANEHLRKMNLFKLDDTQMFLHLFWDQRVSSEQGIELSSKSHKSCNVRFFWSEKSGVGQISFLSALWQQKLWTFQYPVKGFGEKWVYCLKISLPFHSTASYTCRDTG